ncbi:hypothetical protein ACFWIQ_36785 [Kitasatospora sp. NPDC127059]|uniref:hypothetical protein n=1 Tax=unclassified Kitasatospora TaxID=2633591 RepID=UPI003665C4B9
MYTMIRRYVGWVRAGEGDEAARLEVLRPQQERVQERVRRLQGALGGDAGQGARRRGAPGAR